MQESKNIYKSLPCEGRDPYETSFCTSKKRETPMAKHSTVQVCVKAVGVFLFLAFTVMGSLHTGLTVVKSQNFGGVMGNLLPAHEELEAIAELSALSEVAKGWLAHHLRNELQKMMMNDLRHTRGAVNHIVEDLIKIGC